MIITQVIKRIVKRAHLRGIELINSPLKNWYLGFDLHKILIIMEIAIVAGAVFFAAENSPDYHGYAKYDSFDLAFFRFTGEPISAGLLGLSATLYDTKLFYVSGVLIIGLGVAFYLKGLDRLRFSIFSFIFLNAHTMIIFLAPRNAISIGIFLFSLGLLGKSSRYISYAASLLSHNLSFLSLLLARVVTYHKPFFSIIIVAFSTVIIVAMLDGVLESTRFDLSDYGAASDESRGMLRVYYFLLVALSYSAYSALVAKPTPLILHILIITLAFYFILINPFASRLVTSMYVLFTCDICKRSSIGFVETFTSIWFLPNAVLFMYLIFFNVFGY